MFLLYRTSSQPVMITGLLIGSQIDECLRRAGGARDSGDRSWALKAGAVVSSRTWSVGSTRCGERIAAGPMASGLDGPRPAAWPRSSSSVVSLRHVGSTGTVSASAPSDCNIPTSASVISPTTTSPTYSPLATDSSDRDAPSAGLTTSRSRVSCPTPRGRTSCAPAPPPRPSRPAATKDGWWHRDPIARLDDRRIRGSDTYDGAMNTRWSDEQ